MPNRVGFVDNSSMLAHYAMLAEIKDFCEDNGWSILRYDTSAANRELIMSAPGYTGPDGDVPGFVGVRTYQSVASDYYNLCAASFTGYVSGNSFDTQPGVYLSGVPAHNQRIDYWMTINDRRLALAMKVGTPVYESAYLGYPLTPYFTPRQFPYPIVCGGMLTGAAATRFSDTAHSFPYKSIANARLAMRLADGSYFNPTCWPWSNNSLMNPTPTSNYQIRPTGTNYKLIPVIMRGANNLLAEFDGIYAITGFDNAVENTLVIEGVTYIVIQDVARTGFVDYYAMRLDPND